MQTYLNTCSMCMKILKKCFALINWRNFVLFHDNAWLHSVKIIRFSVDLFDFIQTSCKVISIFFILYKML